MCGDALVLLWIVLRLLRAVVLLYAGYVLIWCVMGCGVWDGWGVVGFRMVRVGVGWFGLVWVGLG